MTTTGLEYFDLNTPCLAACPVHTNAGAYVAAVADGHDRTAYLTARLPNPFASVCGRVCAAPCEDVCRRGEIDHPIAIRAIKRFVTEKYGAEARGDSLWAAIGGSPSAERSESIGIVDGGPAGLAALWSRCPHLGCRVPWCESAGEFECPCHGTTFNRIGEHRDGPAPRGMHRFAVAVEDDQLVIDTGVIISGPMLGPESIDEPPGPPCEAGGHAWRHPDTMPIPSCRLPLTVG